MSANLELIGRQTQTQSDWLGVVFNYRPRGMLDRSVIAGTVSPRGQRSLLFLA